MKLVLFDDYRLGVIRSDQVVDAMDALTGLQFRRPQDMMEEVITRWDGLGPAIERATSGKQGVPIGDVRFRPPLPRPSKIICAVVNYLEFDKREPADLEAFLKSLAAVIGSGDTCVLPPINATIFHHEAELAFVIGKTASKVSQAEAMSHIFGYCNFLDMSARGMNPNGRGSFFLGKSWDTFAPMGPALVTADEVPDPHNLQVKLTNNGEPRHDYPTSDVARDIPELLSEFSKVVTLEPGDVVAIGVNHQQIGAAQDGDVLRMEIDVLGPPLVIHVVDPQKRVWPRGIDTEIAERVVAMAPKRS